MVIINLGSSSIHTNTTEEVIERMKVLCQVCQAEGYLQRIGKNYYRIRHYKGLNPTTKKSEFTYCQQSKEYIQSLHIDLNRNGNNSNNIEHLNTSIDLKLKDNSSFLVNTGGVGFEPTTTDLGGRCSIRPELPAHLLSSCSSTN